MRLTGRCTAAAIATLGLLLPAGVSRGQGLEYVQAHYTKYEFQIPMRDGVKLFTSVYVPKDEAKTYPILLTRTPYSVSPYGVDHSRPDLGPSPLFGKAGYIVAYQDVRGCWSSEGEFVHMRPIVDHEADKAAIDESTDCFDTIDWLVKHVPRNNGKVGMWGISYPGFYAAAGSIDAHPALVAVSPQAPVTDWFSGDDWHHNGAFILPHAFNFLASHVGPREFGPSDKPTPPFDYGTPDGYRFFLQLGALPNADARYLHGQVRFWSEIMEHGTYDAFWKARNLRPHLKRVRPAVLTVGGWYDAENLFGALETYKAIEASTPGASNALVMGPWAHGGWSRSDGSALGPLAFGARTSEFFREEIEFPFFERHLRGAADPGLPEAYAFETGSDTWRRFDTWPPQARTQSVYLSPTGALAFAPPDSQSDEAFDEYVSDPARPVPYIEGIQTGLAGDYMTQDQRFASRRPDVLVYETERLEQDLTIAGPITVELFVSTSGTDSDWVVKLIDVYPDRNPPNPPPDRPAVMAGFQQMVRGDVLRGKFREGLDQPRPFSPGQPTRLAFRLTDVCHTFRAGHRIMVQIQSTWFPLVDRNPQTFEDIYRASDADFHKATQRVYRSKSRASRLELPVVP